MADYFGPELTGTSYDGIPMPPTPSGGYVFIIDPGKVYHVITANGDDYFCDLSGNVITYP